MRYPHIAARIFNTPLLIHPQKLDAIIAGLGPRVLELNPAELQLEKDESFAQLSPELFSTKKGVAAKDRGYKIVDGVAVINIAGATVHKSRMEGASTFLLGYNDISADIEHAMENSDVHAVLRVYDSPGGEVQGAFEHVDRIRQMQGKKPMISVADGMAASAAYLAGSAADELVVTQTGYAGSIGVVMRHVDFSRALANDGIQVTHIFAGAHKIDGHPYAPLPADVRANFQEEINGLYEMFVDAVVQNRRISADAVRKTEAAVFRGAKAVSAGLADRVSTTDSLIAELAEKRSTRIHSISSGAAASADVSAELSGKQQEKTANLNTTKGAKAMNLDELRAAHPDLCAALVEEGRAAGFEAGASAERQRIQDVEAQAVPGHEALITTLKFDGKTTGPEAAVQVIAADKAAGAKALGNIVAAAPAAATFAAAPDAEAEAQAKTKADAGKPIDERAKATWDADATVRAEFKEFSTYLSYLKVAESNAKR